MDVVKNHIVKIPEGQPNGGSYLVWPEGQLQVSPPLSREAIRRQIVFAAIHAAFDNADRVLQASDAVAAGLTEGLDFDGLKAALDGLKAEKVEAEKGVPLPTPADA